MGLRKRDDSGTGSMKKQKTSTGGGRGGKAWGKGGRGDARGKSNWRGGADRYNEEQEEHGQEFHSFRSSEGDDGAHVSRKRLDPATKSYFLEIAALLKDGANEEERENICISALEETKGQELQLACDPGCGRVLESLLNFCDISHVVQFLNRCTLVSISMAVDPGASHILEGALKAIARTLLDDNSRNADWYSTLKETLSIICQEFGAQAVDVMCNRYGSHVLRSFLCLLSGDTTEMLEQGQGGGKSVRNFANKLGSTRSKDALRPKGLSFPSLLKDLALMILENCKGSMAQLRGDESASPVLQGLLKALHGDQESITQAISRILDCEKDENTKEGFLLERAPVEDIVAAIEDRSSSHLMEVIIQSAPNSLYVEIFQRFFRKRLLQLSLHQSANFVVQVLISCARHEGQVKMIFEELEGHFSDILFEKRAGVIASLLAACGRFQTKQREASRAVAVAINANKSTPVDLVSRLLHLESVHNGAFPEDLDSLSENKMSVIGSIILQTILSFPKECSQQFCSSIAALESVSLLNSARDPSGSRVLEAFLESSAAPPKHKQRIIHKLEGHFAELALHPIGCFIVEKSYLAADIKLKEKIAAELAPVQAELAKSRYGARISRRCDLSGFSNKPEQWRTKEATKQNTQKAFAELFSSAADPEQAEDSEQQTEKIVEVGAANQEQTTKSSQPEKEKKGLLPDNLDLEGPMAQLGFSFASSRSKMGPKTEEGIVPVDLMDSSKLKLSDTDETREKPGKKDKKTGVQVGTDDIDRLFDRKRKDKKEKKDSKRKRHSAEVTEGPSQREEAANSEQKPVDSSLKSVIGALDAIGKDKKKKKKEGKDSSKTAAQESVVEKKKKQRVLM
ncbi:hypothetical protein R1sor_009433 [Riccia sorocarpa]|uniref:Pumilio homolog 23 n=1 Tax=Riccia sorocarpa TaxID=122646 RepID=A0ABD3HV24_9MARC